MVAQRQDVFLIFPISYILFLILNSYFLNSYILILNSYPNSYILLLRDISFFLEFYYRHLTCKGMTLQDVTSLFVQLAFVHKILLPDLSPKIGFFWEISKVRLEVFGKLVFPFYIAALSGFDVR